MPTLDTSEIWKVDSEITTSDRAQPHANDSMDFKRKIFLRGEVERENYILERIVGFPRVLHLGCSDAPFTAERLEEKGLLHSRLLERNTHVVGFDLSQHGLNLMKRAFPGAEFMHGNVEEMNRHFPEASFDLLIAGEILEHLSNPGAFFDSCRHVLSEDGVLLITVPNIFGIRRLIHSFFGVENYHPDHAFYFSENTLRVLAGRHGFSISKSFYYGSGSGNSLAKKLLYSCVETLPAFLFGNHFLEGLVIELKKRL